MSYDDYYENVSVTPFLRRNARNDKIIEDGKYDNKYFDPMMMMFCQYRTISQLHLIHILRLADILSMWIQDSEINMMTMCMIDN